MKDLGLLLVGWLLGVISPVLAAVSARPFERASLRKALSSELHDIRVRLSTAVYQIADRLGTFDRELIRWAHDAMPDLEGQDEDVRNIRIILRRLLALDDAALDAVIHERQQQVEAQRLQASLSLKRIIHPVVDASANKVSMLSVDLQYRISEIRARVAALNEEIGYGHFFFEKTFEPGITPENYEIVKQSVFNKLGDVQKMGRIIVDRIGVLLAKIDRPEPHEIALRKAKEFRGEISRKIFGTCKK